MAVSRVLLEGSHDEKNVHDRTMKPTVRSWRYNPAITSCASFSAKQKAGILVLQTCPQDVPEITQHLPNESQIVQKLSCDLRHVAIAVYRRG